MLDDRGANVRTRGRRGFTALAIAGLTLAGLALSGCGGGGKAASNTAPGDRAASAAGAAAAPLTKPGTVTPAGGPKTPLQQRDIVRTATLDLTVPDVDQAAASALAATLAAGGRVDGDDRNLDQAGRHASLVLRVPPAKLDGLIASVARLGHENARSVHGQDVTAEHADVDAQVQALTISLGRLQDFLKHSGSIADLISLESQLTQRQAELQSTVAQQQALGDQLALASLTVQLSTHAPPVSRGASGPYGFGSAVRHALHALLLVLRWSAAIAGYLLPFLLVLAAVLTPLQLWRRQHRGTTPPLVGPLPE